jgi:excinuclease ABC subunit C
MSILDTKNQQLQDKIRNAPKLPGCYIYKNKKGTIIYIGKAKNILNRVKSYFINYPKLDIRIQNMIDLAYDVEFITVDSEVESIILETNLIKKYKPKYNILMRDDKNYSWIMFEKPKKGTDDFPRIRIVREKLDDGSEYFGPYPSRMPLKNILRRIRKVFPYANCNRRLVQISDNPIKVDTNNPTPCLYYHLGLCKAPCASLVNKEEYMRDYNSIKKFFRGEKTNIIKELEKEMFEYSKEMAFEKASVVRDKINDVKYVTANIKIDNQVDDVVISELKEQQRENALKELIDKLKFPEAKLVFHKGFKIECYDISNIQGTSAVSAMTVMVDGELRKDLYRRFRITRKDTPDDFGMLQETLERRLKYLSDEKREMGNGLNIGHLDSRLSNPVSEYDESFSVRPDLIIIDGGKGQLSSTYLILKAFKLHKDIPIVGLAKKEEEIFIMHPQIKEMRNEAEEVYDETQALAGKFDTRFIRVLLPRQSESLFLVQRIRDEAHRFGITYHRKLRSKKMTSLANQIKS